MKLLNVCWMVCLLPLANACGGSATSSDGGAGEAAGADETGITSLAPPPPGELHEVLALAVDWTTSAGLELQDADGEISLVQNASAAPWVSCDVSDDQHVNVALDASVSEIAVPFTPAASKYVSAISADLVRVDPSADLFGMLHMEVRSDASGVPGPTIAMSGSIDVSVITDSATTVFYTFEFAEPVAMSSGETYHLVLIASGGYNGDASRQIRWVYDDVFGTNCGAPFSALNTFNGSWNPFARVPQVRLVAAAEYAIDESAELTIDALASSTWDLSTFTVDENPNGESGTILYDVGASEDGIAAYSLTGLTMNQVRDEADLEGRYLHVRARFEPTGGGSRDATLGVLAIDRYE